MLGQHAFLTYGGMEVKSDLCYKYVKVFNYILQAVHFRKLESPVSQIIVILLLNPSLLLVYCYPYIAPLMSAIFSPSVSRGQPFLPHHHFKSPLPSFTFCSSLVHSPLPSLNQFSLSLQHDQIGPCLYTCCSV